jgi:O-antigen/teichoic acid export membrane protein
LRLLPAAVMAVTFPMLVQTADTRLVRRIGAALTVAGVALALVCGLGSSLIVTLVYGAPYLYAAPTFAILSLALPLFFLNYALTHQVDRLGRAARLPADRRACPRRERGRECRARAVARDDRRRDRDALH